MSGGEEREKKGRGVEIKGERKKREKSSIILTGLVITTIN